LIKPRLVYLLQLIAKKSSTHVKHYEAIWGVTPAFDQIRWVKYSFRSEIPLSLKQLYCFFDQKAGVRSDRPARKLYRFSRYESLEKGRVFPAFIRKEQKLTPMDGKRTKNESAEN
jgi:hypothetical protein